MGMAKKKKRKRVRRRVRIKKSTVWGKFKRNHVSLFFIFIIYFCFVLFFFILFTATPVAYGSSLSRDQIRAATGAYATAVATLDLSHICHLHHSLHQCRIFNPLNEARNQTHILLDTSQFLNPLSHNRNTIFLYLIICRPWGLINCKLKLDLGVPVMVQRKQVRLGTTRL